ncbi:hypothetical protein SETIT_3G199600v2 [Setaria italica]|uniref:Uncharacterized protein n=1 Tax=Setaria italica TaxID=4555 RepID=A0A368QGS8_SETIT|nr:hypothetical protein SETIT_3G199600v2 [Setaria italica]
MDAHFYWLKVVGVATCPVWHGSNSGWSCSTPELHMEPAPLQNSRTKMRCLARWVLSAPKKIDFSVDCHCCPPIKAPLVILSIPSSSSPFSTALCRTRETLHGRQGG